MDLQSSEVNYETGCSSSNDLMWSDVAFSFYENQNIDEEFGSGQKPLKKFGLRFGNRIIKLRVADRSILEKKRYFCKICSDAYFDDVQDLKDHMISHNTPIIKRKCAQCDLQYVSSRALAIHCRFVHGETMGYKCDLCAKQFTLGDRFYCKKCGYWYRRYEELIEHEAFCDKGRRGRYNCSFCDKAFSYPRDKVLHERTHTGEKPFSCSVCGAQFSQPSALTVHSRIHRGERKHCCRFCPARFVDSSAARRHEVRIHFSEARCQIVSE
uniref:Zinc finger protein n=1 Tax=Bursaphelenchus xylophilus TaxID=6326 RepID=A0A1I7SWJ9_BURXY